MRLRRDDERGQVIIIVALTMTVLLGFGALALDVGSWFHAHRQLQASVDAGALAGAQDLPFVTGDPNSVTTARTTAGTFVQTNAANNPDSRSTAVSVSYPPPTGTGCTVNNCIAVEGLRQTNGLLASVINTLFSSVHVTAHAQAYVGPPGFLKNVNSAALSSDQYCGVGCNTTLTFDQDGFTLLDLGSASDVRTPGGNVSANQMKLWISNGDPDPLPVNKYYGETNGSKNGLQTSFPDDGSTPILIPVYQKGSYDAATQTVYVTGFAAFIIDKNSVKGSSWNDSGGGNHTLTGTFVKFIAEGLPAGPGTGTNFGVFVVGLNG